MRKISFKCHSVGINKWDAYIDTSVIISSYQVQPPTSEYQSDADSIMVVKNPNLKNHQVLVNFKGNRIFCHWIQLPACNRFSSMYFLTFFIDWCTYCAGLIAHTSTPTSIPFFPVLCQGRSQDCQVNQASTSSTCLINIAHPFHCEKGSKYNQHSIG